MKKILIYSFLILSLVLFVSAEGEPSSVYGIDDDYNTDYEKVQDLTDKIPLDPETGEIDFKKYDKTKADERIEAINEYIGPITKVLWGVELSLSWIFVFSFLMWILLIELIVMPVSEIFDFNVLGSLAMAGIIATLAMQGFGKDFVIWMDSLVTAWYVGLMAVGFAFVFGIVYSMVMRVFGAKIKAAKEKAAKDEDKRNRTINRVHADLNMKDIKALGS